MKILTLFVKSSIVTFIIAAASGVISGLCLSSIIRIMQVAIDTRMASPQRLIVIFLLLWTGYGITSFLSVKSIVKLSENVVLYLRKMVSDKILKASFQSMEMQKNRLLTILTTDIAVISNGMNRLPHFLTSSAMIVGCVVYMGMISWELLVMFIVLIIVALIFYNLPMRSYKERMKASRELQNQLFGYFEALIYGLKELSLSKNLRKSFKEDYLYPASESQRDYNIKANSHLALLSKWGEMLLLFGLGSMLILINLYDWSTFEDFAKFLTVALFLLPALQTVSGFLPVMGKMNVSLEQIERQGLFLDQNAEQRNVEFKTLVDQAGELIRFDDVSFSYFHHEEKKHFKLGPINFSINQGEVVYLIGGNGSGKSTLAKVLCGLYYPESGSLYFAGERVDEGNMSAYRENYGAIFFDFYLFDQLSHIKNDYWREKTEEYLKLLELDKKVYIKDNQLSTTSLSTGQRKRLVLLMTLLEDKPFYLFDEWAASQDPHYKSVFYRIILPDLKKLGKTVFVITHDEQYFDTADRILLMQDGLLIKQELPEDVISFYQRTNT